MTRAVASAIAQLNAAVLHAEDMEAKLQKCKAAHAKRHADLALALTAPRDGAERAAAIDRHCAVDCASQAKKSSLMNFYVAVRDSAEMKLTTFQDGRSCNNSTL